MNLNIIWDLDKQCDLELLVYRGESNEIKNYAWQLLKDKIGSKIDNYIFVESTPEIANENWEKIKKNCDYKYYWENGKTQKIKDEEKEIYLRQQDILKTIPTRR